LYAPCDQANAPAQPAMNTPNVMNAAGRNRDHLTEELA